MLYNQDVFRILEIEPTNDRKAIKKAYAKMVKQYHPEEYPEKWKQIHDAYETALRLAEHIEKEEIPHDLNKEGENIPRVPIERTEEIPHDLNKEAENTPKIPIEKTAKISYDLNKEAENISRLPIEKIDTEKCGSIQYQEEHDSEETEIDNLFEQIEQLSAEQKKQNEELQKQIVPEMMRQFKKIARKRRCNKEEWEAFFQQKDILPIISSREFLYKLGECFTKRKIDDGMHQLLKQQLQLIREYHAVKNIKIKNVEFFDPVEYAESRIDAAYRAGQHRGWKFHRRSWIIAITIVALLLIRVACNNAYELSNIISRNLTGTDQQYSMGEAQTGSATTKESYRYLKKVKLKLPDKSVKYKMLIPDGSYRRNEDDCAGGSLGGISVFGDIVEFSGDKRKEMERDVKRYCKSYYHNVTVGEPLPMKNLEGAEYMTVYYEHWGDGEMISEIQLIGYYVLEENGEDLKEVIISVKICPTEYDETSDEVLKELEKAYGFDLHEYYVDNFSQ